MKRISRPRAGRRLFDGKVYLGVWVVKGLDGDTRLLRQLGYG